MQIPDVNIIRAGKWESENNVRFSKPRFVLQYELECYMDDRGETYIDGVCYKLRKNSVIFCKPGQIRYSRFPFKTRYLYFETADPKSKFCAFLDTLPDYTEVSDKVADIMNEMADNFHKKDYASAFLLNTNLMKCIAELSSVKREISKPVKHPHQQDVFRAINYMKDNLKENKSVADFARETGYSAPHFNAFFKEVLNQTPYEYYTKLKIKEAQRLLISGRNTTEISNILKFNSGSHFCSVFKKLCGMTPKEYIKINTDGYEI